MAKSREVKTCNGFKGCKQPIFTGTEYKELRGKGKQLCIPCYKAITKISHNDELTLLTQDYINNQ